VFFNLITLRSKIKIIDNVIKRAVVYVMRVCFTEAVKEN